MTASASRLTRPVSDNYGSLLQNAAGDGYVRSEGIAAVVLQRVGAANRIYATLMHAKCNTDGAKDDGITFPSGHAQSQLIAEVYAEARVDPTQVLYVETHGTGTKAGDPQEANALCQVMCTDKRRVPLMIGAVKSVMGHAEPASAICSIVKLLIMMQRRCIPPNLHFNQPNPNIPGLVVCLLQHQCSFHRTAA